MCKARCALPGNPRKFNFAIIVKVLASEQGFQLPIRTKRLPPNPIQVKHVKEFYCQDDISRQAPGKKDFKTVWDSEANKDHVQKDICT